MLGCDASITVNSAARCGERVLNLVGEPLG